MTRQSQSTNRPRIGALRHRLVLESPVRVSDGGGGAVRTWNIVANVWAAIDPRDGTESIVAEAIAGRNTFAVHMRYRSDVAPAMRLRLDTRIFEILAVFDADDRRRFLECRVQERNL